MAAVTPSEVELAVAKTAVERDHLDVSHVGCVARPCPQGNYDCAALSLGEAVVTEWDYRVQVRGDRVTVGNRKESYHGRPDGC